MAQGPNEEQRLQLGEIELGLEVEKFLRGTVGKYLLGRAEIELETAVAKLKAVDPEKPKEIRDIQAEIWRCEHFMQWLTDAIINGHNAEAKFTSPHDGD